MGMVFAGPFGFRLAGVLSKDGSPVTNKDVSISVKLYRTPTAVAHYTEIHPLFISNGEYELLIGSVTTLSVDACKNGTKDVYITLEIDNGGESAKKPLSSMPYSMIANFAYNAENADAATTSNYATSAGSLTNSNISQFTNDEGYITTANSGITTADADARYMSNSANITISDTLAASKINIGVNNSASGTYASVAGGQYNTASGYVSTVAGGRYNTAGYASNVGGGLGNSASGNYSTVASGWYNTASGHFSNVAGGRNSTANGYASNVAGGYSNTASGYASNVAGGLGNSANGDYSNIAGGQQNTASGNYSNVAGYHNNNDGDYSVVAGGRYLQLSSAADRSFAFGYSGTPVTITQSDAAIFYISGNMGVGQNTNPLYKLDVAGTVNATAYVTTAGDYAEYFEAEEAMVASDLVGINISTGKARVYRSGDELIGIVSSSPGFIGNNNSNTSGMVLVGLVGQLEFNNDQVDIAGRIVKTKDGIKIGVLLSNGKVFIQ